jgi:hypothetical protein
MVVVVVVVQVAASPAAEYRVEDVPACHPRLVPHCCDNRYVSGEYHDVPPHRVAGLRERDCPTTRAGNRGALYILNRLWPVRPGRPYKSPIERRFTVENATGA